MHFWEEHLLKKVEEYHRHAAECREMARVALPSHRKQLEQMADTWDQLAAARQRQLEKWRPNLKPALTVEFEILKDPKNRKSLRAS